MSNIYGALGLTDRDTTVDHVGQSSIYTMVNEYMTLIETEVNKSAQTFVGSEDWGYLEKVKLPGGGMMQGSDRLAGGAAATKRTGGYDVAYPLYDAKDAMAWDAVSYAYMSVIELDSHLTTVETRMINTKRYWMLRAIMNNTNEIVNDERWGAVTVRRLANADTQVDGSATLYPPKIGELTEATGVNRYLTSGYASSAMSATNNPFPILKEQLEQFFGEGEVVCFINSAETAYVQALPGFVAVTAMGTLPGIGVTVVQGQTDSADSRLASDRPGKLLGYIRDVEVREYRYIPAGYMVALDFTKEAPLRRRVDQPVQLRGFQLIAMTADQPLIGATWRLREGYGVRNRLNGVCMQFTTSGTYTTPTQYQ